MAIECRRILIVYYVTELTGRRAECDVLDQFVAVVRGGASRALVVHGGAGVGKTALLEHMAGHAGGLPGDPCRRL